MLLIYYLFIYYIIIYKRMDVRIYGSIHYPFMIFIIKFSNALNLTLETLEK